MPILRMEAVWFVRFLVEFLLISCLHVSSRSNDAVIVNTNYGQIRGLTQNVPQAQGPIKQIHKFVGIPYAQAPVKELRFQPPQPHKGWKPKLFNARQFGNICPHSEKYLTYLAPSIKQVWRNFTYKNVNEDCLFLNIYTPATLSYKSKRNSSLYPVLFYIHGGSFLLGTPVRDKTTGDILPSYGVILVTIQYRLGPFGFLTTGDSAAPGNYGLLDQVQALKWVNENIVHFGGDPKRITIAGNSAGGASVGLHLLSPLTKGLFQGAIMESGVEFSPFALLPLEKAVEKSKNVGRKLLCDTENSTKMMECLRSKDAADITYYYEQFPAPVVDNYYLVDKPENLRKKGIAHRVPVIIGFTKHDGSHMISDLKLVYPLNDKSFRTAIERSIQEQFAVQGKSTAERMADALEFQYYPWHNVGNPVALEKAVVKMFTDFFIIAPSFKAANFHAQHSRTYVFHYQYTSSVGTKSQWVYHGRNVDYSFGVPFANITYDKFDDKDRNISHFIMTRYTNFVKYGRPTPDLLSEGVKWTEYNQMEGAFMDVKSEPELAYRYHPNRVAFWNYYVPKISNSSYCNPAIRPIPPSTDTKTAGGQERSRVGYLFVILSCVSVQPFISFILL